MPAAIPILAGVFLTAGSVLTAVGVTATIIGAITIATALTVAGIALMAVAYLTMKKPKITSAGQQLDLKLDPKSPVPIIFGRSATGGYLVYRQAFGKDNKTLAMAIALTLGGPIAGFDYHLVNDRRANYSGSPIASLSTISSVQGFDAKSKAYKNKMRLRVLSGAAPSYETISSAGGGFPSAPGAVSGAAIAVIRADYDQEAFASGLPNNKFVIRGVRLYDPRLDSTYQGGSGTHRRDDPTTWTFSENPYLAALQWVRGRYENGQRVYGIGAEWDEIDVAAFASGANIADANGWKVGGQVTTDDDKFAVLSSILQAGGGVPITRGSQISVTANAPKTSLYNITSEDIVGEMEIQTSIPWRARKNLIIPRYREEQQLWEIVEADEVKSDLYLEQDGGELRETELEMALVQQKKQSEELAAYELVNMREFLTVTFALPPRFLSVRTGDCVTVNLPDQAIVNQKCLVISREFDPQSYQVTLTVKSETDAKHDFALGRTSTAPVPTTLSTFDPTVVSPPLFDNWAAAGASLIGPTGDRLPAIRLTGAVDPEATNVDSIAIDYKVAGGGWTDVGFYPRGSTAIDITGVRPNTEHTIRVRYKSVRNILSEGVEYTATSGAAGLVEVDQIVSDAILDKAEKVRVTREFDQETAAKAGRETLADSLSITTQKTAFQTAYTALKSYLEGLSPSYRDNTVPTPIVASTFKQKWADYYASLATLVRAIETEAALRANYSKVVDDNGTKPEDNATIGAPSGTPVGDKLAEDVIGAITDANGNLVNSEALKGQLESDRIAADAAIASLDGDISQARTELDTAKADIQTAKGDIQTAKGDISTARSDVADEITRAKAAEGTLTTLVTTAQGTADDAQSAISTETTQRADADSALSSRIDTVQSTATTDKATLNSRITNEVAALVTADQAISNRSALSEATYRTGGVEWVASSTPLSWSRIEAGIYEFEENYFVNHPSEGKVFKPAVSPPAPFILSTGGVPLILNHTYRITMRIGVSSTDNTFVRPYVATKQPNGANGGYASYIGQNLKASDGFVNVTREFTFTGYGALAGAKSTENTVGIGFDYSHPNSYAAAGPMISWAKIEDITTAVATNARIAAEETARADADSALASRSSNLEASASGAANSINANPDFSFWKDDKEFPEHFLPWSDVGTIVRLPNLLGRGGYGVEQTLAAENVRGGFYSPSVFVTDGYYVIEAEVWRTSGSWAGSGITLDGIAAFSINFMTEPDITGAVGNVDNGGGSSFQQDHYRFGDGWRLSQLPCDDKLFHFWCDVCQNSTLDEIGH